MFGYAPQPGELPEPEEKAKQPQPQKTLLVGQPAPQQPAQPSQPQQPPQSGQQVGVQKTLLAGQPPQSGQQVGVQKTLMAGQAPPAQPPRQNAPQSAQQVGVQKTLMAGQAPPPQQAPQSAQQPIQKTLLAPQAPMAQQQPAQPPIQKTLLAPQAPMSQQQQPMGQPPMGQPPTGDPTLPPGTQPQTGPTMAPQGGQPGQPPQGQPPMGQPLMGQPPQGQPPMGQPPQGQPPMGQPPMGQPPQGQPPGGPQFANRPPVGQQPMVQSGMPGMQRPQVKPVSGGFYIAMILGGLVIGGALMGWGMSDRKVQELVLFAWVPMVVGLVFSYVLLYKAWAAIFDGQSRTSPGKAVGFLFIPFFNLYWMFVAYYAWADEYNRFLQRHRIQGQMQSNGLFLAHCICTLVFPIATIATTIMVCSAFARGINTVAAGGQPQVPQAVARY